MKTSTNSKAIKKLLKIKPERKPGKLKHQKELRLDIDTLEKVMREQDKTAYWFQMETRPRATASNKNPQPEISSAYIYRLTKDREDNITLKGVSRLAYWLQISPWDLIKEI